MWQQNYTPVADSLVLSALAAAIPIFVLLYLLGVRRTPAWVAAASGLGAAGVVALGVYRMPPATMASAVAYGAVFGLFPIGWVIYCAILLYRITLETGAFEILKDSVGSLTSDRRLQALLIAFAFGAFIEGAAGFGTPVAVSAAMLSGLGFPPFQAAAACLLANTAPVAFGSIGTPILTLNAVTGLPMDQLSARVGQICAPISLFVPAYLLAVMLGWRALRGVMLGAAVCGLSFAAAQLLVSNFVGPQLTDILSSLAAIGSLVVLLLLWRPADSAGFEGAGGPRHRHTAQELLRAWGPYAILVVFVLVWGFQKARLGVFSIPIAWPGLHQVVQQMPPVVSKPAAYAAVYRFEWLAASGTACLLAAICAAALLRVSPRRLVGIAATVGRQLTLSLVTVACVLGLAFLMNYSGATGTLGLAFSATGVAFPFFSSMLGWLGVFLTGSDTSANALFGNLQVVTAGRLGLDPVLMAASNSSGGVMGKMISLQSIAVAAAATGMPASDEAKLFRFTLGHSIILASAIGLVTLFYAYVWRL
jgi:lactate permease